jgi:hypothetical protein
MVMRMLKIKSKNEITEVISMGTADEKRKNKQTPASSKVRIDKIVVRILILIACFIIHSLQI